MLKSRNLLSTRPSGGTYARDALGDSITEPLADVDFHLAIAEASHNVVLLHVMRSLFKLLHKSVELSFGKLYLKDSGRKIIREQNKAIMDAILSVDAELAKEESYSHISYVKETLEQFSREEKRSRKSQERLEKITRELQH